MTQEKMELWELPPNYGGETYYEYFICVGQHRDSNLLDRSNFEAATKKLSELEQESESTWLIARANHWAVGWVEILLIHQDWTQGIDIGNGIMTDLADYPILDEDYYCERSYDEACEYWSNCGLRERLHLINRYNEHASNDENANILAARHDYLPDNLAYSVEHYLE